MGIRPLLFVVLFDSPFCLPPPQLTCQGTATLFVGGQGGGGHCVATSPLGHALFRKGCIEDVFCIHAGQQLVEFGRGPVLG